MDQHIFVIYMGEYVHLSYGMSNNH